MTKGFEGGTWLGMTKSGKISFLTNIRKDFVMHHEMKKGRGMLIPKFLTNDIDANQYLESLHKEKLSLESFNLVAGDVCGESYYINNVDNKAPRRLERGASYCSPNHRQVYKGTRIQGHT